MDINESWVETVLRRKHYEESPVRVISIETEAASGKGENYLSTIQRIKATVLLGSGEKKRLTLIAKLQHKSSHVKQMSIDSGIFVKEIAMYRDVFQKMEDLIQEVGDTDELLWAKCFDFNLYDRIVFEDLSVSGYRMAQRREQLDLAPTLFVVKNLGKFHALGSVLRERGEIPFDLFGRNGWGKNLVQLKGWVEPALRDMATAIGKWGSEWAEAKERLEKRIPALWDEIVEFVNSYQGKCVVFNHGDSWNNNILFKFDEETKRPISLKFVDFQLSHVGTPAHDFHWFTISSVTRNTYRDHYNEIVDEYYKSLSGHLRKYGYQEEIPTLQCIKEEFKKYEGIRFWYGTLLLPIVLAEPKDAMDLEEILKNREDDDNGVVRERKNKYENVCEHVRNNLQQAVRDAMSDNVF